MAAIVQTDRATIAAASALWKMARAHAIAGGGPRCHERHDGPVEAEHAHLGQKIGRGPGEAESSECGFAEQPRNQKCEDAAEVRGQQDEDVRRRPSGEVMSVVNGRVRRRSRARRHCCG